MPRKKSLRDVRFAIDPDHEPTVYGYARRSDFRRQEYSIENQKTIIEKAMEQRTEKRGEIFCDDASASKIKFTDRPGAKSLIQAVKPGDTVIVWKLDRMFRNMIDMLQTSTWFTERNVRLVFLNIGGGAVDFGTLSGRLMLQVMAAVAEFESGMLSERVRESNLARKRNGYAVGKYPQWGNRFVYDADGKKREVADEAQMMYCEEVYKRHIFKGESLRSIAKDFQRRCVQRAEGDTFFPEHGKTRKVAAEAVRQCVYAVERGKRLGTWGLNLTPPTALSSRSADPSTGAASSAK